MCGYYIQIVHNYWPICSCFIYYEYNYMKNLIKTNLILAKKFNNTMRYIDDLLTLNNKCFESEIDNIILLYTPELQLKIKKQQIVPLFRHTYKY